MKKLKIAFGIAVLLLVGDVGRQVGAAEISNAELQEDMKDLALQVASRTNPSGIVTDEQLRDAILHKADNYDIQLSAGQITVERTGSDRDVTVYLAADYDAAIRVANYSYVIHFDPSSGR
ncbi:MAG TPA: hypothetical protein VFA90_13315 [Terriglobales bacterium]|nr:hypothetical protein [Terriglobales bacterium]